MSADATPDEQPAPTRVQRGVAARVAVLKDIIPITADVLAAFAAAAGREPVVARTFDATFDDLSAAELAAERGNPEAHARREHDYLLTRDANLDLGVVGPHPAPPESEAKPRGPKTNPEMTFEGDGHIDVATATEALKRTEASLRYWHSLSDEAKRRRVEKGQRRQALEEERAARPPVMGSWHPTTGVDAGMAPGSYSTFTPRVVLHDFPVELAAAWLRLVFYAARGLGIDLPAGPMKAAARRAGFIDDTLDRARQREHVEWVRVGRAYVWRWTKDTP